MYNVPQENKGRSSKFLILEALGRSPTPSSTSMASLSKGLSMAKRATSAPPLSSPQPASALLSPRLTLTATGNKFVMKRTNGSGNPFVLHWQVDLDDDSWRTTLATAHAFDDSSNDQDSFIILCLGSNGRSPNTLRHLLVSRRQLFQIGRFKIMRCNWSGIISKGRKPFNVAVRTFE
jgi:hypothetical protein